MTRQAVYVYNISMESDPTRPPSKASARNQMMDYLSRREHSELQLREKLKKNFEPAEIDAAIEYGKAQGWIPSSEAKTLELSEKTAAELRRKGKGLLFINQYLEEQGLPPIEIDPSIELEKARELAQNKFSDLENLDPQQKAKVGRFLLSRGFDEEIVRKVIYEKF